MLNNFFVDFVIYHNILTVRTKAYLCEGYYRHVNKVEDIRLCSKFYTITEKQYLISNRF